MGKDTNVEKLLSEHSKGFYDGWKAHRQLVKDNIKRISWLPPEELSKLEEWVLCSVEPQGGW